MVTKRRDLSNDKWVRETLYDAGIRCSVFDNVVRVDIKDLERATFVINANIALDPVRFVIR